MAKEITAKFKNRADTATNWASNNPILSLGEIGLEIGTNEFKFGNGVSTWNNLPYYSDIAKDITNNKKYRYRLQIVNGVTQFVYEEVI